MNISGYISTIKQRFSTGISTEHSYRGDLQGLITDIVNDIQVTNEPKRQKFGAPDYIMHSKKIPIGYIEAKDIGVDLDNVEKSEQLKCYLGSASIRRRESAARSVPFIFLRKSRFLPAGGTILTVKFAK